MGCLLGCFGGFKDRKGKRRKQRNKVLPRDKHSLGCSFSHQNDALLSEQKAIESSPISLVELQDNKSAEKLSSSGKKHVRFDSNVKTYDHVSPLYESKDTFPETTKSLTEEEIEHISEKLKRSLSSSEENSVASSVGSYPPNYRYQNCRDSDDDIEECCDNDLDDDDYEEDYFDDDDDADDDNGDHNAFVGLEDWSDSVLTESIEPRTENLLLSAKNGVKKMYSVTDNDTKSQGNARDRSAYVHQVLNPVENLSRWKSVSTRCASELTPQKENSSLVSGTDNTPSSLEPAVKSSSSHVKPKSGQHEGVTVDASLSTWLTSSKSDCSVNSTKSQSSKYVRNFEDRPILGTLTVEELKQISMYSSSPRKSPSRSPDEVPIIGSVGSYWSESMVEKDSP